ncbi:MAG: nucleotidyltransferase [Nitrospirae bacterium RBG_16_64_22]|nr:MAG: nucleotidyltransferase [Nitrospirae bacterium RBG_16_64_22]
MDQGSVLGIISRFRKAVEARGVAIDKIVLYGSHARGAAGEESDIDLVVISRDFERKNYWQRIELLSDAIYEVLEPIEAVAMTPDEWETGESLLVDFAKNGQVVVG